MKISGIIEDNILRVMSIYYFDDEQPLKENEFDVEIEIPEALPYVIGTNDSLFYDTVKNEYFRKYEKRDLTEHEKNLLMQEDVARIKNTILSPSEKLEGAVTQESLELIDVLVLKIEALKESCTNAIYSGFKSKTLDKSFGFNANDQTNFTQQLLLIVASGGNYTTAIQWKTLSGEIVNINTAQFITLVEEAEVHKRAQQNKYWTLESQVKAAKTKEEILSIKW